VSVRDAASQRVLAAIGVEAELVPDPVHLYEPAELADEDSRLVGVALRGGYSPADDELAEGLVVGLRARGFEPVFASHSLHDADPASNDFERYRSIADRLGARITADMAETLALYPRLRAVVSMRLHANILSFVHAVPFVAVSYSTKTDELLDSYSHPYRLPAAEATAERVLTLFDALETDREAVRLALRRDSDTMRKTAFRTLERFFSHGLAKTARRRDR
jgi:polysaccharide pyruvyl transferase WcaK-like protein